MQGQEASRWKGTEEMSQEEEPRNRTAQQMWCGDLGNTSGHKKSASHTAQPVLWWYWMQEEKELETFGFVLLLIFFF